MIRLLTLNVVLPNCFYSSRNFLPFRLINDAIKWKQVTNERVEKNWLFTLQHPLVEVRMLM